LKPQFQIKDILQTIKRYKPTIFTGVPSMYNAINNFRGVRKYGINSIKACISGSAPLHVEVQESFEKLTKGKLVEGYGLTEASPVTHANPLNGNRKVGTIGIPLPSTQAAVVDLARGRKEIEGSDRRAGDSRSAGDDGLLEREEATLRLMDDGWLSDVAQMDENGYFRIIARADMWYPETWCLPPT
jgi:long-chain acyl-CoA synthetase